MAKMGSASLAMLIHQLWICTPICLGDNADHLRTNDIGEKPLSLLARVKHLEVLQDQTSEDWWKVNQLSPKYQRSLLQLIQHNSLVAGERGHTSTRILCWLRHPGPLSKGVLLSQA